MLNNLALGKAGELRVASELLLRGHECFLTLADSGVDLVLGNGLRLQVKSARQRIAKPGVEKSPHYTFSFKSWRRTEGRHIPHDLEAVDFAILWAVEDDAFFVVPTSEVRSHYTIKVNLTGSAKRGRISSRILEYRDRWDLLKGGGAE